MDDLEWGRQWRARMDATERRRKRLLAVGVVITTLGVADFIAAVVGNRLAVNVLGILLIGVSVGTLVGLARWW